MRCEDFVKEKLKAPSTADFGGQSVSGNGSGPWKVTGWVDAQNSFGAKIRTGWTCDIRLDGTTWRGTTQLVDR
jgi:hypothetical protein